MAQYPLYAHIRQFCSGDRCVPWVSCFLLFFWFLGCFYFCCSQEGLGHTFKETSQLKHFFSISMKRKKNSTSKDFFGSSLDIKMNKLFSLMYNVRIWIQFSFYIKEKINCMVIKSYTLSPFLKKIQCTNDLTLIKLFNTSYKKIRFGFYNRFTVADSHWIRKDH